VVVVVVVALEYGGGRKGVIGKEGERASRIYFFRVNGRGREGG